MFFVLFCFEFKLVITIVLIYLVFCFCLNFLNFGFVKKVHTYMRSASGTYYYSKLSLFFFLFIVLICGYYCDFSVSCFFSFISSLRLWIIQVFEFEIDIFSVVVVVVVGWFFLFVFGCFNERMNLFLLSQ